MALVHCKEYIDAESGDVGIVLKDGADVQTEFANEISGFFLEERWELLAHDCIQMLGELCWQGGLAEVGEG